ncbi:MarR family winged helix-turn-helix transcriptional regulator [Deinococcus taeanensis]|uniref:MarR family winged helix-turn-helix transcriptional regulator n=1 Tax=Deinococcus taeanensis TaxID=2737050 RepID=UPI001CDCE1E5|nr:MarR family winged helix-turn-helix transcriptional regulator [Deinococcus taeanensis]UBV43297.1 MarR family winged helix-turn-helix transcriptional regulator [Deinococcus taeanensis]
MTSSPPVPTPLPHTDDLYSLVRLILRLSRRVHHVLDDPLETALGLNTKELVVLATIMDGAATPGAVAQAQNLPAPTVTRMITKLVQAGLVQRFTDPSDLRLQRLELTAQGQATRARTRAVAQDVVHAHFGHLPPERVQAALNALQALDQALHGGPA